MNRSPIVRDSTLLRHLAIGFVFVAIAATGCSEPPPPVSTEKTPWLDVDKQIELLDQNDSLLRALAARNLGKLGADAEKAIPKLESLVNDPNDKVRKTVRESLDQIRAAIGEGDDQ